MVDIDFGKYPTYDELEETLVKLTMEYPGLTKLFSIGQSPQGRELWTVEVTNKATGPAEEKPGLWIDGNTHSSEPAGTNVCLKTIWYLCSRYGRDEFVTGLLDDRVIYVLPRVNPDGAEVFLTKPYHYTAGGILNPEFWDGEGHYEEDVDGDGRSAFMRWEDPNGDWKKSRKDPRLMIKREPEDKPEDGPFYKVMREGLFLKYKPGKEVTMAPRMYLGGTNRNYPAYWAPGGLPLGGAGPFPLWEREPRAIADFWADHPNLSGCHTFHTSGGLILRESNAHPDAWFQEQGLEADLAAYKEIARIGEELTGYPAISIYDEFTFEDDRPFRRGCATSFFYEHLGAFVFSIELWDWPWMLGLGHFRERGGVEFDWARLGEGDQLRELKWIDENSPEGFIDWRPCVHPQLGPVEIGGVERKYTRRNPPPGKWLEYEVDKAMMFALRHAALLPLLRITEARAEKVAPGVYKVSAQIANTGFLPTEVTKMAVKTKTAKPVIAEIKLPEGAELVTGHEKVELGHLDGRSAKLLLPRVVGEEVVDRTRRQVEWVVKTRGEPLEATVVARCPRAGTHRAKVTLQ
ncbi:MAG TPA: M14 family metallopeptidase [Candidatus Desulfaltia sp.]|nr:M14 family metallopeptidase [Candidatus Desulfaltia sp.]